MANKFPSTKLYLSISTWMLLSWSKISNNSNKIVKSIVNKKVQKQRWSSESNVEVQLWYKTT